MMLLGGVGLPWQRAAADEDFARLPEAISHYERIAVQGGWPSIVTGPRLELGSVGPRVDVLRQRLERSGDLQADRRGPNGNRFDAALQAAVRRFQARHGLTADGIVGQQTIEALDVSAAERLRQLRANIGRATIAPPATNGRAIVVNIPEYRLRAYDNGQPVLSMRVVVGNEYNPTPAFDDTMTFLVFRPYWNIPESIALEEMLPQLQRDPRVLKKKGIEAYTGEGEKTRTVDLEKIDAKDFATSGYLLRQRPGPQNPLGNVKFMLPNSYNIYLHDTPSDGLFQATDRNFSHGCVRVANPIELAEFALRGNPEWNGKAIRAAMADGDHRTVSLPQPIPVHIVYRTAWVAPNGVVEFRDDIYRLDVAAISN
jgi:murein L,D-transpeptidase YcbB/YkuD